MKILNKLVATAAALNLALLNSVAVAQDDRFANVTIETIPVAGNISMLSGSGGNIGVSAGEDGILIIDDQYAPLAGRIRQALTALGSGAPEFVLNTQPQKDH